MLYSRFLKNIIKVIALNIILNSWNIVNKSIYILTCKSGWEEVVK